MGTELRSSLLIKWIVKEGPKVDTWIYKKKKAKESHGLTGENCLGGSMLVGFEEQPRGSMLLGD